MTQEEQERGVRLLRLSAELRRAEEDLVSRQATAAGMIRDLSFIGRVADRMDYSPTFGELCIPGSGQGTGLDVVYPWPTHQELRDALKGVVDLQGRIREIQRQINTITA